MPALTTDPDRDRLAAAFRSVPALTAEGSLVLAYGADAVTEVLEWAADGVGADPSAASWLGGLRLARHLGLATAPSAPPQLSRAVDDDVAACLSAVGTAGRARLTEAFRGSFPRLAASYAVDRMGTRAHPLTEAELPSRLDDPGALLRALPLAALVHVEPVTVYTLVLESVAISVSSVAEQHRIATALSVLSARLSPDAATRGLDAAEIAGRLEVPAVRGEAVAELAAAAADTPSRPLERAGDPDPCGAVAERLGVVALSPEDEAKDEAARRVRDAVLEPALDRLARLLGVAG
ncbi:hypothetical protein [Falsarthrobacter nasiphocae]|uniref:Uncharacterized protein n=1 Tax=Falsarthrobacter nasiphocae TaxID=189863 RepID=A0AAE3YHH4_9MICC|nr:hypothetical protein [Falsarthrobacter nasiphocae]MDR6892802.1 hypothetical protein [Falsarthrobacter nasiphocae]